ncbi:DUF5947 family protein [Streptomyces olivochromogenes]|uniref:DUF5947 family protein n=1 Tax=Streptomyces olivochromogenes TaxID=1963 RepID=UPI001F463C3F|nr:DUF5947 family protein [Streptomyces olivochromogenes]
MNAPPAPVSGVAALRPNEAPRTGGGLRRFLTERPPRPERCGLCAAVVDEARHRHLVDIERRSLVCACTACFLLMDQPGADRGRFRAVPGRYLTDPDHRLADAAWDALRIPVGVAFFFRNTVLDRLVALYPSPAGATESELEPEAWASVLDATGLAALLCPDVEALLLRRTAAGISCHLVPIDICYELVGRMRQLWQGFDGGAEARAALDAFFARVESLARPVGGGDRP